jgi:hypothetical protein
MYSGLNLGEHKMKKTSLLPLAIFTSIFSSGMLSHGSYELKKIQEKHYSEVVKEIEIKMIETKERLSSNYSLATEEVVVSE